MIGRKRELVARPPSLDPTGVEYIAELKNNKKTIKKNMGKKWANFSDTLVFEVYKKKNDVKFALSELFGNKCAYCEANFDNEDLHTEHFRPKKKVVKIDDPDQEGYWWLAAQWENLLPACLHCNRSAGTDYRENIENEPGKGNCFPLLDQTSRARNAGALTSERHSLLDPSVDEPAQFLSIKSTDGMYFLEPRETNMVSTSFRRADATLSVVRLNRSGLVRSRTKHVLNVIECTKEYISAAHIYSSVLAAGQSQQVIDNAKIEADLKWNKLFLRYLKDVTFNHLYASILCVDTELAKAGLSMKMLLGGQPFHVPDKYLS